MRAAEILNEIRALPEHEKRDVFSMIRVEFGDVLDEAELTPEQARELSRRAVAFEANPNEGVSWEDLQAEVRQRFGSQ